MVLEQRQEMVTLQRGVSNGRLKAGGGTSCATKQRQTTTTTTREGDAAERGVSNFQTAGVTTLGLVSTLQEANLRASFES